MPEHIPEVRANVIFFAVFRGAHRPTLFFHAILPSAGFILRLAQTGQASRRLDPPRHFLTEPERIRLLQHDLHIRAVRRGPAVCIQFYLACPEQHFDQVLLQIDIGNIADADRILLLIDASLLDHHRIVFDRYVRLPPHQHLGDDRRCQKKDHAGCVAFLGAFPEGKANIEVDVLTCHHAKYYSGSKPQATDDEKPNVQPFPVVQAGVTFCFPLVPLRKCGEVEMKAAKNWLREAITVNGAGAKTAAGYGWFGDVLPQKEARYRNRLEAKRVRTRLSALVVRPITAETARELQKRAETLLTEAKALKVDESILQRLRDFQTRCNKAIPKESLLDILRRSWENEKKILKDAKGFPSANAERKEAMLTLFSESNSLPAQVYAKLSDLRNVEELKQRIPPEALDAARQKGLALDLGQIVCEADSISFPAPQIGQVRFAICDREQDKTLKFGLEGIPLDAHLWIQLLPDGDSGAAARLKVTARYDIPFFMKMMLKGKLDKMQDGVERLADLLALIKYE